LTFFILAVVFVIALLFVLGLHTFDKVDTEIEIDGSTNDVWKALTSFDEYADWNPFITSVSGDFKEGSMVDVTIALPFSKSMDFNLKVEDLKKGTSFSWVSKMLEPKILDSVHYLRVEKTESGTVKFSQGEKFTGLLLYIVIPLIKTSIEKNFEKMNLALKNRVEGVVEMDTSSQIPSGGV